MYELIILNLLIFGLSTSRPEIINWGANTRTAVLEGHEYYRMISAMFLHFDIVHLFLNMLALFAVGRVVEGYFGHARFLLIYLVGGLCACIASLLFNLPNTYSVGASGAIFALFGAQLVLQSKYRDVVDFGNAGRNSLSTIALNLFYGIGTPGVDNWGHIGGLMGGLAVAMIATQLFRFIRPHQYSPKLFTTETHPLVTRNLLLVTLGVTAVLSSTAVFSIFSHTITVEDITVTVPAGWQIVTDFEDVEYCKQGGVECLLGGYVTDDTWFEVIRLSSLGLALSTLETVDAAFASVIETQGAELVSRRSTQIDGREAVIRICDVENTRRMYVLIWDSGRLIRFYAEASRTTYENYRQDMESIAASIKFQAK
jgi:membrane associated rhomboid family serine protease